MRRAWKVVKELAWIMAVMFVAGAVVGGCATVQKPIIEDTRWSNKNDPPQIKPMPNYIKYYDHDRIPWPHWV